MIIVVITSNKPGCDIVLFQDMYHEDITNIKNWMQNNKSLNNFKINIYRKNVTGNWHTENPWFELADSIGYTKGSYDNDCITFSSYGVIRRNNTPSAMPKVRDTLPMVNLHNTDDDWFE